MSSTRESKFGPIRLLVLIAALPQPVPLSIATLVVALFLSALWAPNTSGTGFLQAISVSAALTGLSLVAWVIQRCLEFQTVRPYTARPIPSGTSGKGLTDKEIVAWFRETCLVAYDNVVVTWAAFYIGLLLASLYAIRSVPDCWVNLIYVAVSLVSVYIGIVIPAHFMKPPYA